MSSSGEGTSTSTAGQETSPSAGSPAAAAAGAAQEDVPDMSLLSIIDGENPRGIPVVKFIDDVGAFAESFTPPASAELLIGAYTELHSKFKTYETSLSQKQSNFKLKVPEMEHSLALIESLKQKRDQEETVVTRYNLADDIYGKAELDLHQNSVNLWLGANVMLQYTFEEAIAFLSEKLEMAKQESANATEDLAFVRDQIVTSEVSMSRMFNWDVRKKRTEKQQQGGIGTATGGATSTAVAST